jgi:hypothetical protein
MTVKDFIVELGGATVLAKRLGIPMPTVASWIHYGNIPNWRFDAVRKIAEEMGVPVPKSVSK